MKKWHKILLTVSVVMAFASWVMAIYYWPSLPQIIPTHFDIYGQADGWSDKSFWSVFLIPLIQSLILSLFFFLYAKPQYSDLPTTLWLTTLDEKAKEHAFGMIRTMLVVLSIFMGALFTFLTIGTIYAANGQPLGPDVWIFLYVVIFGMMFWIVYWTFRVYRVTREAIKNK